MKSKNAKKANNRSSRRTAKRKKATNLIARSSAPKTTIDGTMTSALKQVVARLKNMTQQLRLGWKRDALLTYEIGADVAKVRQKRATYGSKAVETLAEELELDKATLYRWAGVAAAWPKTVFAKLAERRSTMSGLPLTWSHFELLSKEKDSKRRGEMVERALGEALTVVDLGALIKGGARKSSGRTLPVATSASPKPNVWNRAHDLVEEQTGLVKALSSITAKPLTDEHAELMKELYASCKMLMKAIEPVVTPTIPTSAEASALTMAQ